MLKSDDPPVLFCTDCNKRIEYRQALIMKCNNSHLPGYTEMIKKARDALREITRGDGRYVRFFYPESPCLRSMSRVRRSMRKRKSQADWEELRERLAQAPGSGPEDESPDYVVSDDVDDGSS